VGHPDRMDAHPSHPWAVLCALGTCPSPSTASFQDTGGHCSEAAALQSVFVAGVWGSHWQPRMGGEGTQGPGPWVGVVGID
jgi:hypothetical protein